VIPNAVAPLHTKGDGRVTQAIRTARATQSYYCNATGRPYLRLPSDLSTEENVSAALRLSAARDALGHPQPMESLLAV